MVSNGRPSSGISVPISAVSAILGSKGCSVFIAPAGWFSRF